MPQGSRELIIRGRQLDVASRRTGDNEAQYSSDSSCSSGSEVSEQTLVLEGDSHEYTGYDNSYRPPSGDRTSRWVNDVTNNHSFPGTRVQAEAQAQSRAQSQALIVASRTDQRHSSGRRSGRRSSRRSSHGAHHQHYQSMPQRHHGATQNTRYVPASPYNEQRDNNGNFRSSLTNTLAMEGRTSSFIRGAADEVWPPQTAGSPLPSHQHSQYHRPQPNEAQYYVYCGQR